MKTDRKLFLSIDWDFFVPEKPEWDWGHQENGLFIGPMWQLRMADFFARGEDLREEMKLATCAPHARKFWETMRRLGYKFTSKTRVTIGESHSQAAAPFLAVEKDERIDVLHFDAHADSGYGDPAAVVETAKAKLRKNETDCGTWLLTVALKVPTNVTYVYPQWKGLKEWKSEFKGDDDPRLQEFLDHRAIVYDEERLVKACRPREVDRVFICRSGAWTPPWLDDEFQLFAGTLMGTCKMFTVRVGAIDPMMPRRVDAEQARKIGEGMREMMLQATGRRNA